MSSQSMLLDLGPLEALLRDPQITDIMVTSTQPIYVERAGQLIETEVRFTSNEQLMAIMESIVKMAGKTLDKPMLDIRLSDNSRVNIVLPPVAVNGPTLTIWKYQREILSWEQIIEQGTLTPDMEIALAMAVSTKTNIVIAGAMGSGKTTFLNALSEYIPEDERVITVEASAELQLRNKHLVMLESQAPDANGRGEITVSHLIHNALRMRPDRIIASEVVGEEAWQMIQVMNMGYRGSMFTLHANTPQDALEQLEIMATAATNLPLLQIRGQIASGVQLLIQMRRFADGQRRVMAVTEVVGMKNTMIETQDVYRFIPRDYSQGDFVITGHTPRFMSEL
jgi:pilus assembly protein CpaF